MKISGIYKIQSKAKPEKVYIGSAVNIIDRFGKHKRDLLRNKHHNSRLQNHYNKYGAMDLIFAILLTCEKSQTIRKEQCFINIYNPWFNLSPTAGSSLGIKRSKDFCEKIRVINTGIKRSNEQHEKIRVAQTGENNSFFGKTHTAESNEKRRQWALDNNIKPPGYHGGSKKGRKYNKKQKSCLE